MSSQVTGTQYVEKFDYNQLKDRKYTADDYNVDAEMAKGPLQNRRCTDCLFLLIFMGFLGLMGYMTIDGYVNGDAEKMLAPIMTPGIICGYNNT